MESLVYGEHHHHHLSSKVVSTSTLRRSCSLPKFNGNGNCCKSSSLHTSSYPSDFITVVQVDEARTNGEEFITVLEVDSGKSSGNNNNNNHHNHHQMATIIEQVTVYRLPGERLGMALKFEGGANCDETISNLFIQNINPESPSSRIQGSALGKLKEGDELLEIDGRPVNTMTRIECVAVLTDVPVCFKMLIRRQELLSLDQLINAQNNAVSGGSIQRLQRTISENGLATGSLPRPKRGPPPPVPTRLATTSLTSGNGLKNKQAPPAKKRPSQPPPLPPRRSKDPSFMLSEKTEASQRSEAKNGHKIVFDDDHDSEIIDVNQNDYRSYDDLSDSWLLSTEKRHDSDSLSLPVSLVRSTNGRPDEDKPLACSDVDREERGYNDQTIVNSELANCLPAPQEFGDCIEGRQTVI